MTSDGPTRGRAAASEPGRRAAAGFFDQYGRAPTAVAVAPGRVTLIGEFTDFNGGPCLPFALQRTAAVAAAGRPDAKVVVHTARQGAGRQRVEHDLADLAPGRVSGWAAYPLGVLWALGEAGYRVPGVDLYVDGDVPVGAGLSSSAALEVATGMAVDAAGAMGCDLGDLVRAARRAENEMVGVPSGSMDQLASAYGREGHALLIDTAGDTVEPVPFDPAAAGLAVVLVDTGVRHDLGDSGYGDRRADCERAAALLGVGELCQLGVADLPAALGRLPEDRLRRRTRHVLSEAARVDQAVGALRSGRIDLVGPLLDASHASLRDDFEVSCPELDVAVAALTGAGALGARMVGGGFGGCALGLIDAGQVDAAGRAAVAAFRDRGWAEPAAFVASPGPAAHLV